MRLLGSVREEWRHANSAITTFTCSVPGSTQLSIAVTDGICGDQLSNAIPITCIRGPIGGTGGGGSGGGGGGGTGGVLNDTCAAGPPVTSCPQGTASVGTVVQGIAFDAYEGHVVKAALSTLGPALTRTTTVSGGMFNADLLLATTACNLGANTSANAALFVDVNGDGTCDPTVDLIYVWTALGGPAGTCVPKTLLPASQQCGATNLHDFEVLAARAVCPALTCSPICPQSGFSPPSICGGITPPECIGTETNPPPALAASCGACLVDNYNPATDGCCGITDALGASLCSAASACLRAGGAPVGVCNVGGDTTSCFCGTNVANCGDDGAPNGPCVAQMTAAAGRNILTGTTDAPTAMQVLSRLGDPAYALGRAANIAAIAGIFCPSQCGF